RDDRAQVGVAAEAPGQTNARPLGGREEGRPGAEAEAGDRNGTREPRRVVQRRDHGRDLGAVEPERGQPLELRDEGQLTVAREELGQSRQIRLATTRRREAVHEQDRATRVRRAIEVGGDCARAEGNRRPFGLVDWTSQGPRPRSRGIYASRPSCAPSVAIAPRARASTRSFSGSPAWPATL